MVLADQDMTNCTPTVLTIEQEVSIRVRVIARQQSMAKTLNFFAVTMKIIRSLEAALSRCWFAI